ncbi:GGDEF domain-containing protein [Sutcliffiella deserti]|uniref:GGDEF domain-containing protein n=1 Tax=Sutcliffiella deserti TaxID=2875501 RepID=UPI001CBD1BD5|nr:diguanylate cyclase [Sutcliffiella deserti]
MFLSDLFINLCILLSLIFIYLQVKWNTRIERWDPRKIGWIDGIAGGVFGNVLMYFSIQITDVTIVDLRYIPVMLLMLFIGIYPALISTILIIAGRFLFGWNFSSIAALILMIILFIGFLFIVKKMKHHSIQKKAWMMIGFTHIVFSIIISIVIGVWEILIVLIPVYWITSAMGGLCSVYIVQYLSKSHNLLKEYEIQSSTDFLTGLNNVRQFDETWNELILRAKDKGERLSLLLIDIDFFKKVNDTYGHQTGDVILQELGNVLRDSTRSFDIISRNGGEEFSVILPDCPNYQAIEVAEKIRLAVEKHPFAISLKEHINITVSIGVATYPETILNSDLMIKNADVCLYKAKSLGRNRVCC